MDGNAELLNYIHQNSEMGQETIKQLTSIVNHAGFKKILESQLHEYEKIFNASDEKLKAAHKEAKEIGPFKKTSAHVMINLQTMKDKTPSHISEMLIQGSTMGIVDMTKKLKEYQEADQEILDLGEKLLKFEQANIEELKRFLQ